MTCVDGLMVALYKFISSSRTICCLFQCVVLHWPLGPQHSASKQQRLFLFRGGSWAAMGLSDILAGLLLDLRWITYLSTKRQIGAPSTSAAGCPSAQLACCSYHLFSDRSAGDRRRSLTVSQSRIDFNNKLTHNREKKRCTIFLKKKYRRRRPRRLCRPAIVSSQAPGVGSNSPPIQLPAARLLSVPSGGGWLAAFRPALAPVDRSTSRRRRRPLGGRRRSRRGAARLGEREE